MMQGVTVGAMDYEIIRLGLNPTEADMGNFADVHVGENRYVAGYLMLEEKEGGEAIVVSSHGRAVAHITSRDARLVVTPLEAAVPRQWNGASILDGAGLGYRADLTTLILVHGPAASKIESRILLADSLLRIGGRP